MRNLPKDEEYWVAVNRIRALDFAIKEVYKTLDVLGTERSVYMNRVYQSPNWAEDIDPDWTTVET